MQSKQRILLGETVSESGRTVVRQDLARCHRTRRIHFRAGPEEKAHAQYPSIQQSTANRENASTLHGVLLPVQLLQYPSYQTF